MSAHSMFLKVLTVLNLMVKKKALMSEANVVAESEQPVHSETDVLSLIQPLQSKAGLS